MNDDLSSSEAKSSPVDERLWGPWQLICLWAVITSGMPMFAFALPLYKFGFSWWQVLIIILLAQSLSSITVFLLGKPGAKYGVPFVYLSRSVFGIRGSKLINLVRLTFAILLFASLVYIGSVFLASAINSWNVGFNTIPQIFPSSWNISTQIVISFVIAWVLFLIPSFFKVVDMRYAVLAVAAAMCTFLFIAVLFSAVSSGTAGPLFSLGSSFTSWSAFFAAFFSAVFYLYGYYFVFALSYSDFTRSVASPEANLLGTCVGMCVCGSLFSFFGYLLVSIAKGRFYSATLEESIANDVNDSAFITIFALFTLLSGSVANWALNTVSGSFVLVSFFPQMNLRLSGFVVAVLGFLCFPLTLSIVHGINLGQMSFISGALPLFFGGINSFGIFIAPVVGIVLVDYLFINDQSMDVEELAYPVGKFWFTKGFNWRAFLSFFLGLLFLIPGLVGFGLEFFGTVSSVLYVLNSFNYVIGLLIASVFYFSIMTVWPPSMYDDEALELTVQRHRNTFSEKEISFSMNVDEDANVLGI